MSVLIKGMEMPDKCRHCRFSSDFDCAVTGHFIPTHSIRQLDCPLVEVPTPHGDLIDRDKLPIECITFSKRKMYRAGTDVVFVKDILDAPTIIEAEEKT